MQVWGPAESSVLDTAVATANASGPSVLVVHGDAGVGKTTMLDELGSRAAGFCVLAAEGVENDTTPYGVLAQWGVDVGQTIDGTVVSPFMAAQGLRAVIDELAADGPVLLRLDDLHWADPESVRALTWLLRRAAGDHLLVAVATRPTDAAVHAEWTRWAAASEHVARISLTGLSSDDAVTFIQARRPTIPVGAALRLWEHTSGNPLYLTALLHEHDATELLRSRVLPAPAEFAHLVRARTMRMPTACASLLRAVSVFGTMWVPLLDARAVAEVTEPLDAASLLAAASLLQSRDVDGLVWVRVAHALVRSAVYQQIPPADRRALHLRAAQVLAHEDAALEHRVAAVERYDDALAGRLERFAEAQHRRRLHRSAAQHLRWSSALTTRPADRGRRWLESLFESLLAHDFELVRTELTDVERVHDIARRTLVLGTLPIMEGRWHDGARILEPVSREPLGTCDPRTRYRLEVLLAWARVGAGHETAEIADGLDRAGALGADDPAVSGYRTFAAGQVAGRTRQHPSRAQRLTETAGAVPLDATYELAWRGVRSLRKGLFPRAIDDLTETQRRIQDGLIDIVGDSFHAVLGQAYWLQGEWSRARLHIRLALEMTDKVAHPVVVSVAPITDVGDGDFAAADRHLHQAETMLREAPWQEAREFLLITQVIRLHAGPSTADRAQFLNGKRDVVHETARTASGTDAVWLLHAALAALWAWDLPVTGACIAGLSAARRPAPWVDGGVQWLKGLAAEVRGDHPGAMGHLEAAAGASDVQMPLYSGHVLVDHARIAGLLGRYNTADGSLRRADSIYRRLGAAPYVDRVAALRTGSAFPRGRHAGPGLTDREQDILTLVVAGLSYVQIARDLFITRSTVGYHLSNIYAKTGVATRHQLTEAVRRDPRYFNHRGELRTAATG